MKLGGKTIAIVGLARSGVSAAKLCARRGAKVIATDAASESALKQPLAELRGILADVETDGNSYEFLSQANLVVVSPGVPLASPALVEAKEKGMTLISEVELAFAFIHCPIVAITGSNGKTTTTLLAQHFLEASGLKVFMGGNIGTPLSDLPLSDRAFDVAVVELSSFQLEAIEKFTPQAATVLNITEDHMDRYPTFEDYAQAKMNLMRRLPENGLAVVNALDSESWERMTEITTDKQYFGDPEKVGAWVENGEIVLHLENRDARFNLDQFSLLGGHNKENAMAAILLTLAVGATVEGIQKGLDTFAPPAHRLEPVAEKSGVRIFNDSKATSPASVATALSSFTDPVILLMGGRSKGTDFSELNEPIKKHARAVYCFGEAGPQIAATLSGLEQVTVTASMEEAIDQGFAAAKPGDVLLLSPGCASFDAFNNYEHRGERFKEVVRGL